MVALRDEVVEGHDGRVVQIESVTRGDGRDAVEVDGRGIEGRKVDCTSEEVRVVEGEDVVGDGSTETREGLRPGRVEDTVEVETTLVRVPDRALAGGRLAVDIDETAFREDRPAIGRGEGAVDLDQTVAGEIEGQTAVGDHVDLEGEAAIPGVDGRRVVEGEGSDTSEDHVAVEGVGQATDAGDVVRDVDRIRPEDREDVDGVSTEIVAGIGPAPTGGRVEVRIPAQGAVI